MKAVNPLYIEMGEILPSNFDKCFFRYDLVIGCAVYVTAEIYLWAILSLTAFYSEFKMIENHKVGAFKNFTTHSSYYVTAFGYPTEEIEHATISKLSGNVFWRFHGSFSKENSARGKGKNRFFLSFFTVTQITFNGFLSIGFVLYCISAVILLIGISEVYKIKTFICHDINVRTEILIYYDKLETVSIIEEMRNLKLENCLKIVFEKRFKAFET